jgi:hypothetical protein
VSTDDRPRLEATARLGGEFVRMIDGVLRGPRGRLMRRLVAPDGGYLFSTAETRTAAVWWPAGSVRDVLKALRVAIEAAECRECRGAGCKACQRCGYVPTDRRDLLTAPVPPTLPLEGDVGELWGWVRGLEG